MQPDPRDQTNPEWEDMQVGLPKADSPLQFNRDIRSLQAHGDRLDPAVVDFFGNEIVTAALAPLELEQLEANALLAARAVLESSLGRGEQVEPKGRLVAAHFLKLTTDLHYHRIAAAESPAPDLASQHPTVPLEAVSQTPELTALFETLSQTLRPVNVQETIDEIMQARPSEQTLQTLSVLALDLTHSLLRRLEPSKFDPSSTFSSTASPMRTALSLLELSVLLESRSR